jgi:PadR family transcriptional regulator PadR
MTQADRAAVLANLRRGTLEYCVLAHLDRGPAYGLDIARSLGAGAVLFESEGTLYPLLSRLRKAGWVTTRLQESSGGAARRYYELTDEGRAALRSFVTTWHQFTASVDAVLTGGTP